MRQRFDTPNWLISVANKSREVEDWVVLGGLYRALLNPIHGSNSPVFKMVRWPKAEDVVNIHGEPIELPVAEADDSANILTTAIYRLKKNAVVVGAGRLAVEEILGGYSWGQPAVAITYKGISRAGVLPDGVEDYGLDKDDMYSAALREGRSDFGVGLGVWFDPEKTIVVPEKPVIIARHVPVSDLPDQYPGTILV